MEGAALAAKRKADADLFRAYDAALFNGAAFAGKLDKCRKFLPAGQTKKAQTPSDMIAAMREFQSRGANMKFTRKPN
jgi:hypothetical protein